MILDDTNAISDFADANQRLLDRLQQADDDIHLPVIVLGEYRYGLKSSLFAWDGLFGVQESCRSGFLN